MASVSRELLSAVMVPVGLGWPGIVAPWPLFPQCPALISYALGAPETLSANPLLQPPTGVLYREPPQNHGMSACLLNMFCGSWPVVMVNGTVAVPRTSALPGFRAVVVTVTARPLPSVFGDTVATRLSAASRYASATICFWVNFAERKLTGTSSC